MSEFEAKARKVVANTCLGGHPEWQERVVSAISAALEDAVREAEARIAAEADKRGRHELGELEKSISETAQVAHDMLQAAFFEFAAYIRSRGGDEQAENSSLRELLFFKDGTIAEQAERIETLERQALHFVKRHTEEPLICGICGKLQGDVEKLICGEAACICSGCVATASGISVQEQIIRLEATVAKAFLRVKELEEALEFYADPESYQAIAFMGDHPCGEFADDFSADHGHEHYDRPMPGRRARDVLCHSSPVPGCETSSPRSEAHQSGDGEAR